MTVTSTVASKETWPKKSQGCNHYLDFLTNVSIWILLITEYCSGQNSVLNFFFSYQFSLKPMKDLLLQFISKRKASRPNLHGWNW